MSAAAILETHAIARESERHSRLPAQAIASASLSCPKNRSSRTTKFGAPKMPRARASSVYARSCCFTSGDTARSSTLALDRHRRHVGGGAGELEPEVEHHGLGTRGGSARSSPSPPEGRAERATFVIPCRGRTAPQRGQAETRRLRTIRPQRGQ